MFGINLETLAELGLQGWPLVAAIAIVCTSVVALWHGEWPWQGIIKKNYNYTCDCTCKSCAGEDEE
jgi:hypothetical protein